MRGFSAKLIFFVLISHLILNYAKLQLKYKNKCESMEESGLSKYADQMNALYLGHFCFLHLYFEYIRLYVPRIDIDITEKICF